MVDELKSKNYQNIIIFDDKDNQQFKEVEAKVSKSLENYKKNSELKQSDNWQ